MSLMRFNHCFPVVQSGFLLASRPREIRSCRACRNGLPAGDPHGIVVITIIFTTMCQTELLLPLMGYLV